MKRLRQWQAVVFSVLLLIGVLFSPFSAIAASAEEMFEAVKSVAPTISADGKTLVLPEIAAGGYELKLYGSSNEAVIDMDGHIHTPLVDMDVTVMYQMVNTADETDVTKDNWTEVSVTVPGLYTADEGDNAKPNVVPGLREWKGHTGDFVLTDTSRIVAADAAMATTGEQIAYYFLEMLGREIDVVVDTPVAGDIYLAWTDAAELGEEGYTVEIADMVTVNAYAATGALYAGTSLTQILYQDEAHAAIPKGLIRDYPQYEVRSVGYDCARFYIPLDYLTEITKYMAYFKLNEIHVHLNDDSGEQAYAFRLESKKYPVINSSLNPDEVWSQEDYKTYQKEMAKLGIDVISEIDTPAHSGFASLYDRSYTTETNSTYIDLSNEDAKAFIKSLLDEFLDGDDPVFQSGTFNIGTDEYDRARGEEVRQWMNELIDYVRAKGVEPRMWAALGDNGFQGETEVYTGITVHHWAKSWANPNQMIDAGYDLINNYGPMLYVVPGVETPYANYMDITTLYNSWDVNECELTIPEANPHLKGAEGFFWSDAKTGMSEFDVFDRMRDVIVMLAEKNWCGSQKDGQTAADFTNRVAQVDQYAPGANPAAYVESAGETVAEYDFESVDGGVVSDSSANGYHGTVADLSVVDGNDGKALQLNGSGTLSLPVAAIGFPYTVSFDLYIDAANPASAVLFSGNEGTLYLNFEGSGKIAYQRHGYTYVLDTVLETGKWQKITLSSDNVKTALFINDVYQCSAEYLYDKPKTTAVWGNYLKSAASLDSSTFVLPVTAIGGGVIGMLDNLTVSNVSSTLDNTQKWLEFTAEDLTLVGDGSGWWRWTDTGTAAPDYSLGMVNGGGHYDKGVAGAALIHQFAVPADGTLTIQSTGDAAGDITMGTVTNHDFSPAQYAITDQNGKIVFPTNGNLGVVINSVPVSLPTDDTLSFTVQAGDVYNFVLLDNYGTQIPMTFKAAVTLNGTRYDSGGLLQGSGFKVQGENGWRYQYATEVTVNDTAPEVIVEPNMLVFDAVNMELIAENAWARWGDTASDYVVYMTTTGYYNKGKAGYAHINRYVVPRDGTLTIDTAYTTGITMGGSAAHDVYPVRYAITDKTGKIVFPTDGQLGTVTYSNPVSIPQDQPLTFDVKAGDEFNFIMIDDFGYQVPMNFAARVLLDGVNQDSSGALRGSTFNTQGENGWYYQYAVSVAEQPYEEVIVPTTTITHNMTQWKDYAAENMLDSSESSYAWFTTQKAGQYVQFSFNTTRILNSISVLTAASGDVLAPSLFQVSMTGEEDDWHTVAELASVQRQSVEFACVKANYARIYLTQDAAVWLKLYEVVIGETDRFYGDVNGDERTDVLDVVRLARAVYGIDQPSDIALYDINGDEVLDEQDVTAVRKYILGSH
ncbi:MAG: family 20 glycosylhydrolase [Clostridia bacterium]|nr:family 20 glycosylhydrolase [Clostridia bacterium]